MNIEEGIREDGTKMAKIKMTYELYGKCMWHSNCGIGKANGIMKNIERKPTGDVFVCLHCGKRGFYPVGGIGCIVTDEIVFP
ncbi:MAG: hypothetical protein Q8P24_02075 [Desulfobacterales bacterium]|nr:hypothetical protein [Desulfobacterales bacterium]MDZ4341697.1 hypothetical protein [Candidatus Binatia bacterium]